MTARGTWKRCELLDARDHSTERIPVTGREGPDWISDRFAGQSKLRKCRPAMLEDWLDKITAQARELNRIGIVVWRTPNEDRSRGVVLVRYDDWLKLTDARIRCERE